MELNHSFDAVAPFGPTPCVIRQPASMKVLINGHVVAKTLRRGKQGIQFNLLDGLLFSPATLNGVNSF
jgi:hypothetical protein